MDKFKIYTSMQLKRAVKLFPAAVFSSLLIFISLALTALMLFRADSSDEGKKKVDIAIVGNTEDSYLGFGIGMLNNVDTAKISVNFSYMTEAEAKAKLAGGYIAGYMIIDEEFIEALGRGENIPLTYVSRTSSGGFIEVLVRDAADIISSVIINSERAIYAMQAYMNENGKRAEIDAWTQRINMSFLSLVLSRKNAYEIKIVDGFKGAKFLEYYASGLMIFFTFLLGIGSGLFLIKRDMAVYRLLYTRGHNEASQVCGEYLAFFLLLAASVLTIILAVSAGAAFAHIDISGGNDNFRLSIMGFFLKLMPVIFMLAAIIFFIYESGRNIINSVIAVFITALSLSYISGCLYPADFFPEIMQKISALLPLGAGLRYLLAAFTGEDGTKYLLIIISYTVIFLILSFGFRKRNIKKTE